MRRTKIDLQFNNNQKKMLVLKFISGSNKGKEMLLDPEDMPIVFGLSNPNQETGQQKGWVELQNDQKICEKHFEIDYDKIRGSIKLRNLNFDTSHSCGLYKMLID